MEIIEFFKEFLLHTKPTLERLIAQYDTYIYIILFLVVFAETGLVIMPFLPGDSMLFTIGFIAHTTGSLDISILIPLLILAALLGDNLNYYIGHKFGDYVQSKERILFLKREHIDRTEKYFEKNGGFTIIIARFIPIVRTVAPFVAGAGEMKYKTYISYCILGAIFWVAGIILLGYFLGKIPWVEANFEKVILTIIVISLLPIVTKLFKK